MRPPRSCIPNTAFRHQRHPRFRLTEPTCRREQRAPRYGAAGIAVAAGSRAAHRVPNPMPAPMGRPVLKSIQTTRPLLNRTPVDIVRKTTQVQRALIPASKPTGALTASSSWGGDWIDAKPHRFKLALLAKPAQIRTLFGERRDGGM